jgi:hypothetical protein
MVDSVADWLCNLMIWAAIGMAAVLLYDGFVSPGFLHSVIHPLNGPIALVVVAALAALWPKH